MLNAKSSNSLIKINIYFYYLYFITVSLILLLENESTISKILVTRGIPLIPNSITFYQVKYYHLFNLNWYHSYNILEKNRCSIFRIFNTTLAFSNTPYFLLGKYHTELALNKNKKIM